MAQYGNELYIHTSRLRYTSDDGKNHQSNLTIKINIDQMKVTDISDPYPSNHVSHSFNQHIYADKNNVYFVDHGDARPRSRVR